MTISSRPPGRAVKIKQGVYAHVPDPLPPRLEWTPTLMRSLSEADRLIGWLAGEGRRLPNPHLLMRPFLAREAVLSSRIEGTQATLGEVLAADAGAAVGRSPGEIRDVANYVAALDHGIDRLKTLSLSLGLILEIHGRLMQDTGNGLARPGEFRSTQNWIGSPGCSLADASYIPPPPEMLMECLGDLETFLQDTTLPPLAQIALAHYQFEAIHPFIDGNGRVGRLLITLFLVERGVLPTPLLYLSAFFEATRSHYYERLRRVSMEGDWESWLLYFFNGVARQAEDALDRAETINDLMTRWRQEVGQISSKVAPAVLERLAANPYITARKLSTDLNIAFTTAQRTIDKMVDLGILREMRQAKRDRVYCARGILDILERPARLVPSG